MRFRSASSIASRIDWRWLNCLIFWWCCNGCFLLWWSLCVLFFFLLIFCCGDDVLRLFARIRDYRIARFRVRRRRLICFRIYCFSICEVVYCYDNYCEWFVWFCGWGIVCDWLFVYFWRRCRFRFLVFCVFRAIRVCSTLLMVVVCLVEGGWCWIWMKGWGLVCFDVIVWVRNVWYWVLWSEFEGGARATSTRIGLKSC